MAAISLDQKIKAAVGAWRERGYHGVSPVTKPLLEFWFVEEHLLKDGSGFSFWRARREATEPLIWDASKTLVTMRKAAGGRRVAKKIADVTRRTVEHREGP